MRTKLLRPVSSTIGYYVAFTALGLEAAILGPTLPGLAENTHSSLSEISAVFAASSLGYLLGSLLGGRLYDRAPGHPVMATVLVTMAGMLALVPLISVLWLLPAAWVVLGAAAGVLDVGGNTLLVWVHGRRLGPFMNALHFFFGAGAFISPIIVAQTVSASGDIAWSYWALALLALPGAFWLLRVPSPAARRDRRDDSESQANHLLPALIAVFLFLYVGAEVAFSGWIFTYAVASGACGEAAAAHLTSAFWGALTLGRLATVPAGGRMRPRFILLGCLLGCLASVGALLLWPESVMAVWLGTLGLGLSMAAIFPTTITLAERQLGITGRRTGLFLAASGAGGILLPWTIGQLFEPVGPAATLYAIAVDLTAALIVFAAIEIGRGRSQTEPAEG